VVCKRSLVTARVASIERPVSVSEPAGTEPGGALEDPWEDEKWTQYKWTVYRGVAYDLTPILDRHPGGTIPKRGLSMCPVGCLENQLQ
jgi:fatty acid desaturase (delta-4 desaturase)